MWYSVEGLRRLKWRSKYRDYGLIEMVVRWGFGLNKKLVPKDLAVLWYLRQDEREAGNTKPRQVDLSRMVKNFNDKVITRYSFSSHSMRPFCLVKRGVILRSTFKKWFGNLLRECERFNVFLRIRWYEIYSYNSFWGIFSLNSRLPVSYTHLTLPTIYSV